MTDHKASQYIFQPESSLAKTITTMLQRWAIGLSANLYEIQHYSVKSIPPEDFFANMLLWKNLWRRTKTEIFSSSTLFQFRGKFWFQEWRFSKVKSWLANEAASHCRRGTDLRIWMWIKLNHGLDAKGPYWYCGPFLGKVCALVIEDANPRYPEVFSRRRWHPTSHALP